MSSEHLRAAREREREHNDQRPTRSRCAAAGCSWSFEGTLAECREASEQHRVDAHEWVKPGRLTFDEPVDGRELLDRMDRGEPVAAVVNETAESPHGDLHTLEEEPMADRKPQRPRGYWTFERIIEGFKEHHRRTGAAPSTSELNGQRGPLPDYLPAYSLMRKVATYDQVLEAAELEKPKRAASSPTASRVAENERRRRTSPPREVEPEPEVDEEPEDEQTPSVELERTHHAPPGHSSPLVRLLSKLTTEDLELAVDEIEQLRRRLDAEHALIVHALEETAA